LAAVAMIRELHQRSAIESLLSALRWPDGPALLQACGWAKPGLPLLLVETPLRSSGEEELPSNWSTTLEHWINRWGTEDARSTWLAAMVLVAEKPARLLDHRLMPRAQRLIKLVALTNLVALRRAPPPPSLKEPARSRLASNNADLDNTHQDLPLKPLPTRLPERKASADTYLDPAAPSTGLIDDAPAWARGPRHQYSLTSEQAATGETSPNTFSESYGDYAPPAQTGGEAADDAHTENQSPIPHWSHAPQPTSYAGLFFLLPIMSRLGISTQLEADPHLIELGLPERLFHHVAQRLAIPADDPAMSFLNTTFREEEPSRCEFVMPQSWRQGLCDSGPCIIRRMEKAAGTRILFDGSGRLALSLWRGRIRQETRDFINDLSLKRGPVMALEHDLHILLEAWLIAIRRWSRRYARLGLYDLVCRRGRVATTRTHIDVLFDHRQADVRVRKAGLDLDPGWVPWFGRVAQFHYLYGEQTDGG
jgi:hypothetical protein